MSFQARVTPFIQLKTTKETKNGHQFLDAYNFCEEYFPKDMSEFFCGIEDVEDKWSFNYQISTITNELDFNSEEISFLDISALDTDVLIKQIKSDELVEKALKILDEHIGAENYDVRIGLFNEWN